MTRTDDQAAASDPALDKTVSAEDAGVTPGGAAVDGGRLTAGTKLGRYEIVEFIGGGGMGWVYRAKDTELEREVAIKVVQPTVAGAKGRERLLAEARAMAKLRHRAVVPVHDVGEYAGGVYVAMALVKGGTLHDWMHAEARPWRQIVARFLEAGRGLVAAHAAGIVHRDFKPRNVLVGEGGEVMVADFGIASASADAGDGEGGTCGTRDTTSIVGTPAYMAPEQAAGQAVDARADQYSFCVSLWEGLHGQRPQEAETRTQGALLERSSAAPKSRRRVPGWLTDAVARGFAPAPEKRWPTLTALLDQLEHGLGRRRRLAVGGAAVFAIAGATIVAWYVKTSGATARPCATATAAWNASDKAKVSEAFLRVDAAVGGDALARIVPRIDAYVERLTSSRLTLCRATGAQSVALVDRRSLCFERREAALASLIRTLSSAEAAVVVGAVDTVDLLPPVEDCAVESELATIGTAPPSDLSTSVDAVRARLAEGDDQGRRGHAARALEIYEGAVATARAVGWAPLLGEALERVLMMRDTLERAAAIYQREGLRERQAQVLRMLGNIAAFAKGDAAKGRSYFEQALELMRVARGPGSLEYADMEVSLGAFLAQDGCRGGVKELEHARSILEPLRHPSLVAVYGQLGECMGSSDPDGAARVFAAGMALCQDRGCPPGTVDHFRAALGTLLASTRGGRGQGLALLHEALANYKKLGDTAMQHDVEQRLRDATSRKPR